MLAGFFLKKVVFTFSESGLFFSFSLFFVLTCCKLGALDFIILLRFHSNRIIQTRIFLYVCKTPAAVAAAAAPAERHGDASATKAPASPAFPAVVAAAASAAASETSRRRRHEEPLRPPHPKFKPAHFVRVSCRKFKIVVNLDFLGCQHLE